MMRLFKKNSFFFSPQCFSLKMSHFLSKFYSKRKKEEKYLERIIMPLHKESNFTLRFYVGIKGGERGLNS
jgi:hypothetical protein